MTRTKLKDRTLPAYTRGEEIANMVTHIVGGAFGIVALVLSVVKSALYGNAYLVVGCSIYGAALIFLYTMSSIYHGLLPSLGKKVMQVMDHCTIYFLIGGTYTPIVLGPIRELVPWLGWTIFGVVWGVSALGTVFTAIDHNRFKVLSMLCYILVGWVIILATKSTIDAISLDGFLWLLLGGVMYTIGALLYILGKKKRIPYMHSVFHVFVLLGTAFQFISIFAYCI